MFRSFTDFSGLIDVSTLTMEPDWLSPSTVGQFSGQIFQGLPSFVEDVILSPAETFTVESVGHIEIPLNGSCGCSGCCTSEFTSTDPSDGVPWTSQIPTGQTTPLFSHDLSATNGNGTSFNNVINLAAGEYFLDVATITTQTDVSQIALFVFDSTGNQITGGRVSANQPMYLNIDTAGNYTFQLQGADANDVETLDFYSVPTAPADAYRFLLNDYGSSYSRQNYVGYESGIQTLVTFSFNDDADQIFRVGDATPANFVAYTEAQKAKVREMLQKIADRTGLQFVEVEDDGPVTSDLIFHGADTLTDADGIAELGGTNIIVRLGNSAPDGFNLATMWHEIGHALGLKHPFEGDARNPNIDTDPNTTFFDNDYYTVMSYTSSDFIDNDDFSVLDWAALEFLYGTAADSNATFNFDATAMTSTVTGTAGNDRLSGTVLDDVINAGDGNDIIGVSEGADQINGQGGNDTIGVTLEQASVDGGSGNDTFTAGFLANSSGPTINGGDGYDIITSTGPNARLVIVEGDVTLTSIELIQGRGGDDFFNLSSSSIETRMGGGNDQFYGSSAVDVVHGDEGADQIFGNGGNDSLYGDGVRALLTTSFEAQIFRSYLAVLGRAPDEGGLNTYLTELRLGNLDQGGIISDLVASGEFQATYGSLTNAEFVELLYTNVLPGNTDQVGRASYIASLDSGALTRTEMVLELSNSVEFTQRTTLDSGAFGSSVAVDPAEGSVFRLYQAVFGRDPDLGGFEAYVNGLQASLITTSTIAAEFVASAEFQATYGALSNAEFVELLYTNVLPGNTDQAGRASYTASLDSGALTRTEMVLELAQSYEFWLNTRSDALAFRNSIFTNDGDNINGGGGNDTLFGGRGADIFEYHQSFDGADTILDFTQGVDRIELQGTGSAFDTLTEILAVATQNGNDTIIDFGGGNTLTLRNVQRDSLTTADFSLPAGSTAEPKDDTGDLIAELPGASSDDGSEMVLEMAASIDVYSGDPAIQVINPQQALFDAGIVGYFVDMETDVYL